MEEAGRLDSTSPTTTPSRSTSRARSIFPQSDWPRNTSRENTPLSRFLNLGIRQMNRDRKQEDTCGTGTGVSERSSGVQAKQETGSFGQLSVTDSIPALPDHTPVSVIFPPISLTVTSPSTSTPNSSPPPQLVTLPEGPPTRSPVPPDWIYSDPSLDSSNRASCLIASANSSPLHSPNRDQPLTNSRWSLNKECFSRSRSRSPFLGISALTSKQASQFSLDWDNYASIPTYFKKKIPAWTAHLWEIPSVLHQCLSS